MSEIGSPPESSVRGADDTREAGTDLHVRSNIHCYQMIEISP